MARGQPAGEEVYRPEVNPEDLPRKIVPEIRDATQVGSAISRVGDSLNAKYQADSAAWAGDQVAQARTKAVADLDAAKSALPAGQDPGNFTQKFLASFDKNTTGLAETSGGNPLAQRMVQKGLGDLRDKLAEHVMGWEAEQRVAYRTDSVKTNLKTQADVVEAHPELAQSVGSTLMDQINSVGGDPRNRLALGREMHAQVSLAAAYGLTRQDPRGVVEALNDPDHAPPKLAPLADLTDAQREAVRGKANGHLSDSVNVALASNDIRGAQRALNANADVMDAKTFESSQRAILATEEHNLVMQEKWQKVASDNLSKEGDRLVATGKMTPDWIEAHHKTLEANEVRYFYKAMSGTEEAATDPRTFTDLYLRAAHGEDVREEARKATVDDHTLSRQDFTKVTGLVDQERPGYFKRGVQFLEQSLDPGQLNPDPAAHQSRALALQDWQEWAAKHPDATDTQARTEQNELANHYKIIPDRKVVLTMKAPMHLVGTRANPMDETGKPDPMLNATKARMLDALKAGDITQEEAAEEASLILQYRQIYQGQQAAAAAAKAKKAAQ